MGDIFRKTVSKATLSINAKRCQLSGAYRSESVAGRHRLLSLRLSLNSLGYHLQTENKDQFLSTDFGLKEFNVKNQKERIRRYRRYVYEAGAVSRPDKMQAKVINDKIVVKDRKKDFEISRSSRFRYRTHYFTDSGIIGSMEFVAENYHRLNTYFTQSTKTSPNRLKAWMGCIC